MFLIRADTPGEAVKEVVRDLRYTAEMKRKEIHTSTGVKARDKIQAVAAMLDYVADRLTDCGVQSYDGETYESVKMLIAKEDNDENLSGLPRS